MAMWKRSESKAISTTSVQNAPSVAAVVSSDTKTKAVIGPEICVKGGISGAEDLLILGSVEGTIELSKNIVTIGRSGSVKANISAKTIHVEGEVEGDLTGSEQVIVHRAGQVIGNITAPRVALEDGARVKGTIDTDSQESASGLASSVISEKAQTKSTVNTATTDTRNGAKPEARVN